MTNKEISKVLKLNAQLLELHGENEFKIKSYQNASFKIERHPEPIENMEDAALKTVNGIGSGIFNKVKEILLTGTFNDLDTLIQITPAGVMNLMNIKGIGPKKVAVLWKELGIESKGELLYACNENRLVELKGFGIKTQELIQHAIEYSISNEGNFHYSKAESVALQLLSDLKQQPFIKKVSLTGELRRKCEIIQKIPLIIDTTNQDALQSWLSESELVTQVDDEPKSDQKWKTVNDIPLEIFITESDSFYYDLFITTGSISHTDQLDLTGLRGTQNELEIYERNNLPYIEPELREGLFEFDHSKLEKPSPLLEFKDLKGVLHNHTTYSDGMHSLEQMATYCRDQGYQYFGVCDHSGSAFYANGLNADRVLQQHEEIDSLNHTLAPFKILKGIESDILIDGSLDYPEDILARFDFVVASVHSVLRMDKEKATQRLIKAIKNPFTTILGHPTGRLLLAREGYPIDHEAVIKACADHQVVIELNANPYRLDIDWRWIQTALKYGVMISVNPDAHSMEGIHDMYYGVCVGRKGGLNASMTFNSLDLNSMMEYLSKRKLIRTSK